MSYPVKTLQGTLGFGYINPIHRVYDSEGNVYRVKLGSQDELKKLIRRAGGIHQFEKVLSKAHKMGLA